MCLSLEAAISAEEQRSAKATPFFPITIGRSVCYNISNTQVQFILNTYTEAVLFLHVCFL